MVLAIHTTFPINYIQIKLIHLTANQETVWVQRKKRKKVDYCCVSAIQSYAPFVATFSIPGLCNIFSCMWYIRLSSKNFATTKNFKMVDLNIFHCLINDIIFCMFEVYTQKVNNSYKIKKSKMLYTCTHQISWSWSMQYGLSSILYNNYIALRR